MRRSDPRSKSRGGSRDPFPRRATGIGKERFAAKGQGEILERFKETAPALANLARSMPKVLRDKPLNRLLLNQIGLLADYWTPQPVPCRCNLLCRLQNQ